MVGGSVTVCGRLAKTLPISSDTVITIMAAVDLQESPQSKMRLHPTPRHTVTMLKVKLLLYVACVPSCLRFLAWVEILVLYD